MAGSWVIDLVSTPRMASFVSSVVRQAADRDYPAVRAPPFVNHIFNLRWVHLFHVGGIVSPILYSVVSFTLEAWFLASCLVPFGREMKGRQRRTFPAAPRANSVLRPGRRCRAFHSGPEPATSLVSLRMYSLQPVQVLAADWWLAEVQLSLPSVDHLLRPEF